MQIQLSGQGMQVSTALRELVLKKFQRLQSHAEDITSIHINFHVKKIRQSAEANVSLPGTTIHARAESEDMYKTVDLLVKKLLTQLTKHKEKTDH